MPAYAFRPRCCASIRPGTRCARIRVSRNWRTRRTAAPIVADLLQRLRERKLVQWSLAHVAAAFALIQVLDVVAQRFGWPERVERWCIVALALGFFVVLVLAWYHGERGAQRVSGTELLILAVLFGIGGAVAWRVAAR